jgi:hypothetical protein
VFLLSGRDVAGIACNGIDIRTVAMNDTNKTTAFSRLSAVIVKRKSADNLSMD